MKGGRMKKSEKAAVAKHVFGHAGEQMVALLPPKLSTEELYARVIQNLLQQVIDRVNALVSQNNTLHGISRKINNDLDEMKTIGKGLRAEVAELSELRLKRLRKRRMQRAKRRKA
jgi:hypothetical protein